MTRDGIVSILAAVVFGIVVSVIGRDWIISSFSADPVAAVCFTLCAFAVGYLISSLVHHNDRSAAVARAERERDEAVGKASRLAEDNDKLRGGLGTLRAESEWYKAKLAEGGTVMTEEQRREEFGKWLMENVSDDADIDAMFADDEADAAKLGTTVEQVWSLGDDARRALHHLDERACSAFRDYCSKCITVQTNDGNRPTWPCNSQGGIPAEFFPTIAVDMRDLDLLISNGLIGASSRIQISGSDELLVEIGGRRYSLVSMSMFTVKTTGERTESAFFYPLTGVGEELAGLCDIGTAEGLAEAVTAYLTSNRMRLTPRP